MRVKVKKLKQIQTPDGLETIEEVRDGTVLATVDAQSLYSRKPMYSPTYRKAKKETKFPVGTKILQIQLDGDACPRNFLESDLVK